jgi:hypothetical protein
MKINSSRSIAEFPSLLLSLASLVVLSSCVTMDDDSGDAAYQRQQNAQEFLRDREQRKFMAEINPGFMTPVAGYGVGTGGSGWFVNDAAAYNGLYQLQSR